MGRNTSKGPNFATHVVAEVIGISIFSDRVPFGTWFDFFFPEGGGYKKILKIPKMTPLGYKLGDFDHYLCFSGTFSIFPLKILQEAEPSTSKNSIQNSMILYEKCRK